MSFSDADRKKALATQRQNREIKKQEFPAALLECNGNIYRACLKCGVSRTQYFSWCREDPEFKELIDEVWPSVIDDLESQMIDIGYGRGKGNVTALCAVLNARAKDRGYGIGRQELTGLQGGPVTFHVVFDPLPTKVVNGD